MIPPQQIDALLDIAARARRNATAMPWAEPPKQADPYDLRDAAEADEFDALMAQRDGGVM